MEKAIKELNDTIMPIGAKMYEEASKEQLKADETASDDKKKDEPVEGEVVDEDKK